MEAEPCRELPRYARISRSTIHERDRGASRGAAALFRAAIQFCDVFNAAMTIAAASDTLIRREFPGSRSMRVSEAPANGQHL